MEIRPERQNDLEENMERWRGATSVEKPQKIDIRGALIKVALELRLEVK
jgi:hypothetical protein